MYVVDACRGLCCGVCCLTMGTGLSAAKLVAMRTAWSVLMYLFGAFTLLFGIGLLWCSSHWRQP